MLKIEEESVIKIKTKLQGLLRRKPYLYISRFILDNAPELKNMKDVDICVDKKNKVIYFKYGDQ